MHERKIKLKNHFDYSKMIKFTNTLETSGDFFGIHMHKVDFSRKKCG
jgi:hypothetical protein